MQETQETRVLSLGWEDPLEEEMATHSSIVAWKISWREEPGCLQSMGSQRVRHAWTCPHRTAVLSWSCTEQQELWIINVYQSLGFFWERIGVFLKGEILEMNQISHTLPLLGLCPEELAGRKKLHSLREIFYVLNWISLGCDVSDVFLLSFIF